MSTPTLSGHHTASNQTFAQTLTPEAAPAAAEQQTTARRGGLRGRFEKLLRLQRPCEPVDRKPGLDAKVRAMFGEGAAQVRDDRFGMEGSMGELHTSRMEIEALFPGTSKAFVDELLLSRASSRTEIEALYPGIGEAVKQLQKEPIATRAQQLEAMFPGISKAFVAEMLLPRASSRKDVERLFPGISEAAVTEVLESLSHRALPMYGNAPRYSQALVLAHALAQATGHDPARAEAVMQAWRDPSAWDATTQADHLITHCLLATAPSGWDLLEAFSPSPYVKLSDSDEQRRTMTTALTTCGHLLNNVSFNELGRQRPQTLGEAADLARDILDQGALGTDGPREDADPAYRYESNVIAARALLGALSVKPSPIECEAMVLFDGGKRTLEGVAAMRNRLNEMMGGSGKKPGFWARVRGRETAPITEQRVMDELAQSITIMLAQHIETNLKPPTKMENGRRVTDDTPIALTDQRVRDALHMAALNGFAQRIGHKPWSDGEIKLTKGTFKSLVPTAAQALGVTTAELLEHPACRPAHEECRTLEHDKLSQWLTEAQIGPASEDLGKHLKKLNALCHGWVHKSAGISELIATLKPGSSIAFTGRGAIGPNVTLWATLAPAAWAAKVGHPTVTPLPTVAKIRGRGAAVMMSGEEGPDGAYIDIDIGTFDRRTLTMLAGVVAQVHTTENFWWNVFEKGFHRQKEQANGLKLRIKADDFETAKRRALDIWEKISDGKSDTGADTWERLMAESHCDDDIKVFEQKSEHKEKARIGQVMTVLGQNVLVGSELAVPPNPLMQWGVNTAWGAGYLQWSRTKGTQTGKSQGAEMQAHTINRREQHWMRGPLIYTLPIFNVGTFAFDTFVNGGHGAWLIPGNRTTKGLENNATRVCVPPAGTGGTAFQEMTMSELEYMEWSGEYFGESTPRPPAHASNQILPDRSVATPGARDIVVRRYLTESAAAQLRVRMHKIQILTSAGVNNLSESQQRALERECSLAGAILIDEKNYGQHEVWDQYSNVREKVSGLPPLAFQAQAFVGAARREREHLNGRRPGGRNTVVGTRVPEVEVPEIHNQRVWDRNQPVQYAPPVPRLANSPMQDTLREIFANYPAEWIPPDPVILPSHMQLFGRLFHLVQLRNDDSIYPKDSPIRAELNTYLFGPDSMAAVDSDPMREPEEIMADFDRLCRHYATQRMPVGMAVPENLDTLPDEFWRDLDIAAFWKANFHRPVRPVERFNPPKQKTLRAHLALMRDENQLDMSNPRPYSSVVPVPKKANVPTINRFRLDFGWDDILSLFGQVAAGDIEGVKEKLHNTPHLISVLGLEPNANATHFTGRAQPSTHALTAEAVAEHLGSKEVLVKWLHSFMAEWYSKMRGADELAPGRIFNGVTMLPNGNILSTLVDYGAPQGARPEGYREDREIAEEAFQTDRINSAFTFGEMRLGAADGEDFNEGQRNPTNGRRELTYSVPLQENAHMAELERVIVLTLRATGDHKMADLMDTFRNQRIAAMKQTFFEPRKDIQLGQRPTGLKLATPLQGGSYYRLREGELHPLLSAQIANALWADAIPDEALESVIESIEKLATPDGLRASMALNSKEQWDGDNFWAMHVYKAVVGLMRKGYPKLAERLALAYTQNAVEAYKKYGVTAEKYNPNGETGKGGEYPPEMNMTMTNEFLEYLGSLFPRCAKLLDMDLEQVPVSA